MPAKFAHLLCFIFFLAICSISVAGAIVPIVFLYDLIIASHYLDLVYPDQCSAELVQIIQGLLILSSILNGIKNMAK